MYKITKDTKVSRSMNITQEIDFCFAKLIIPLEFFQQIKKYLDCEKDNILCILRIYNCVPMLILKHRYGVRLCVMNLKSLETVKNYHDAEIDRIMKRYIKIEKI